MIYPKLKLGFSKSKEVTNLDALEISDFYDDTTCSVSDEFLELLDVG
jgi:hypothetical protein